MGFGEFAGLLAMSAIGSIIAQKFKTRERFREWFDSLKLTWFHGTIIVFVIFAVIFGPLFFFLPFSAFLPDRFIR